MLTLSWGANILQVKFPIILPGKIYEAPIHVPHKVPSTAIQEQRTTESNWSLT